MSRTPGGQITADNHYFDTDLSAAPILGTPNSWVGTTLDPVANCIFSPLQGDDISNRQGRKVFVKKIRVNGVITVPYANSATTLQNTKFRLILYQDMQTNGTQAQGDAVMSSGTASQSTDMFQNLANLGRFKVLKDKVMRSDRIMTGTGANIVAATQVIPFKFSVKPLCYVNYNATNGGAVADVVDNSWHIACCTLNNISATLSYKVRTVFTA